MPTAKDLAIHLTLESAAALGRAAHCMPPEKLTWRPLDAGRTALEQVIECGGTCHFVAQMLRERVVPGFDRAEIEKAQVEYDTLPKALELLRDGADRLVAAIKDFPEEHMGDTLTLPFGPGITRSFAEIIIMPYWNMSYHLGQINYIQTLYGDREMH